MWSVRVKCLNNLVEQDHRAIKRVIPPMLGFKSFRATAKVLAGIELMHMIRKGQMVLKGGEGMSYTNQFYVLAGKIRPAQGQWHVRRPELVFSQLTRRNPLHKVHILANLPNTQALILDHLNHLEFETCVNGSSGFWILHALRHLDF